MDPILVSAMAVGLIAAYPGWYMCQKAYLTSRWRFIMAVMCLTVPVLLAAPMFFVPFWVSKDKEVAQYVTFSDLLLFAICPLGLLALVAYVMDHFSESPVRPMFAGTACFTITLLPIAYYFYADQMHTDFGITIQQN